MPESLQILNGPAGERFAVLRVVGRLDSEGAPQLARSCVAAHAASAAGQGAEHRWSLLTEPRGPVRRSADR